MPEVTLTIEGLNEAQEALDSWLQAAAVQAEFGWLEGTSPDVLTRAHAMEYELASRPGYEPWAIVRQVWLYANENLAQDIAQLYDSGLRGQALMEALAQQYAEHLRTALLNVMEPPLAEFTVAFKRWKKEHGLSSPQFPPEKIWIDTAETFEAIDAAVVPVGGA
jgi:hypothetical protein